MQYSAQTGGTSSTTINPSDGVTNGSSLGKMSGRPLADQHDRRSKQRYLIEIGRTVLLPIFERMQQVSQLVSGNLAAAEKPQLIGLLGKLEAFHDPIYKAEKQSDWPTMVASYLAR
jgi:hypothetical protein